MPRDMRWKQLMHIFGEIYGAYHDASFKMGMADSAMQILYSVHMAQDALYPSEIARLCGMSRQTVSSALRALERQGVLYLETGAGRSRPVRLTQAGEALCRERVAPIAAAEESIWNGWTEEDRSAYLRLSRQYLEDLRVRVEALTDLQHGGKP